MQGAPVETAAGFEEQIGADIASLESRLRKAAGAVNAAGARQPRRRDGAGPRPRARRRLDGAAAARPAAGRGQRGSQRGGRPAASGAGQRGDQAAATASAATGGRRSAAARQARPAAARGAGSDPGRSSRAATAPPRGADSGGFEPRQFQREARERRTEAQALRRDLQALGVDVKDLDAIIGALAALDSARVYADADEITRLQRQLAETLQRFQFSLRRDLGAADADQLLLSGADAAPEAYRKQIEEYYRSLARGPEEVAAPLGIRVAGPATISGAGGGPTGSPPISEPKRARRGAGGSSSRARRSPGAREQRAAGGTGRSSQQ